MRQQIKKRSKLASGIEAKWPKTSRRKTRHYCINNIVLIHVTLPICSGQPKPSSGETLCEMQNS